MPFKFNGVEIPLQPSTHRWIPSEKLDDDGNDRPIYGRYFSYELAWQTMSYDDFDDLVTAWRSNSITGSTVVDLPEFGDPTYAFYSYSGCILERPEPGEHFEQYLLGSRMTVRHIST